MLQEITSLVLTEFIKLTITGIIGGFIGSFIGLAVFKSQRKFETRHNDLIQKREALRDALMLLTWMDRDIFFEWNEPINENETPKEHVVNVRNKFSQWKAMFLDEPEIWKIFEDLDMLVGVGRSSFSKIYEKEPNEILEKIEETLKIKILEVEKEIK